MLCLRNSLQIKRNKLQIKSKRKKKILCEHQKKGVNLLMSDKVDFRGQTITRDRNCHYTVIQGQPTKKSSRSF